MLIQILIVYRDDERATQQFLFNQASSNESVTTLDTWVGGNKPNQQNAANVHEIAPSPTKKRKESHFKDESDDDCDESLDTGEMNIADDEHDEGADKDGIPNQHEPAPPGLLEGPGALS